MEGFAYLLKLSFWQCCCEVCCLALYGWMGLNWRRSGTKLLFRTLYANCSLRLIKHTELVAELIAENAKAINFIKQISMLMKNFRGESICLSQEKPLNTTRCLQIIWVETIEPLLRESFSTTDDDQNTD